MKLKGVIVNICRLILAAVFIFSGYVKAIDPLGTQYKIQDYLESLGLQDVLPDLVTLVASMGLAALEFSLGVFMLFAIRRRITSRLTLAFMIVMTIIAVWLVLANPVEDCGCFGDAVKLTNGETLIKNIVLLACAVIVAAWPLYMVRLVSKSTQWIFTNYTVLFILSSSIYSLYLLPIFDFRPYHVGADIRKGMEIPEDAPQPKFETTFILKKDGVQKEFTLEDYPDSTWEFVDSKTVQTEKGYVPPIHDFSIELNETGEDITEQVLSEKGYTFLLISPHLEHADDSNFGQIDELYEYAQEQEIPFYCLTASSEKPIRRWMDLTGAEYPFCKTDETTLKTIIRSNPGLVLIKDGTIIRKWSHNNLPVLGPSDVTKPLDRLAIGKMPDDNIAGKIASILLWFFMPLFLLAIADRTWAWTKWIKKKENSNKIYKLLKRKKKMRKKIVAGNWKMNMNLQDGIALAKELNETLTAEKPNCGVVICTPFIHLASLGHSERREYYNETPEILKEKVLLALKNGLKVIFCIGETLAEREAEKQNEVVKAELEGSVFNLSEEEFRNIVIAYEPIWAIGTGKTATAEQAEEIHAYIRSIIAEKYGAAVADDTSILYGGSCKASNAPELFAKPDIDGGLIGGASLKAADFKGIIDAWKK